MESVSPNTSVLCREELVDYELHEVFFKDSLPSTHPLRVQIDNPEEEDIFDDISYTKVKGQSTDKRHLKISGALSSKGYRDYPSTGQLLLSPPNQFILNLTYVVQLTLSPNKP